MSRAFDERVMALEEWREHVVQPWMESFERKFAELFKGIEQNLTIEDVKTRVKKLEGELMAMKARMGKSR